LAALSSLGYGQTWQDLTASRALGTTYYNTTGKPIQFNVRLTYSAGGSSTTITIGGVSFGADTASGNQNAYKGGFIVPPGSSYLVTNNSGVTLGTWLELR
jgi:hypothetical protein